MKCRDCPAFKVDGYAICLLMYPHIPMQLEDENEEADYCQLWEMYKVHQENTIEKIINFLDFSPTHVFLLEALARTKNNEEITKKDREYDRVVVHDEPEFRKELAKMRYACQQAGLKFYIYVTMNPRNTKKSYAELKRKLALYDEMAMNDNDDYIPRIARIDEVWYKACLQEKSKDARYFLLDIDTKDVDTRIKLRKIVEPVLEVETRNGFHWVVDKFDTRLIADIPDVGVQRDGRLFVEAIGFEE